MIEYTIFFTIKKRKIKNSKKKIKTSKIDPKPNRKNRIQILHRVYDRYFDGWDAIRVSSVARYFDWSVKFVHKQLWHLHKVGYVTMFDWNDSKMQYIFVMITEKGINYIESLSKNKKKD